MQLLVLNIIAQSETLWQNDIDELNAKQYDFPEGTDIALITGSSSARFWTNMNEQFPEKGIINTGFGGSQMHELLYYVEDLIIKYLPAKVFIYEGDNDLATGKTKEEVIESAAKIVNAIHAKDSNTRIHFISPKPSIARWDLSDKYIELNKDLELFTQDIENVFFIDVWNPMLNQDGTVRKDIFIEDGLHMNKKGYEIWADQVRTFIEK